jgi:agmatinase
MNEQVYKPMNFGGIDEPVYSAFDFSRILILPVSSEEKLSFPNKTGAMAIIDTSRNMELYEEETDAEVYKIGIHTLDEFKILDTSETWLISLYQYSKELLKSEKILCVIGGNHSTNTPIIRSYAEKFHNLSVLRIGAHADLLKDFEIPSVQVGIRSISADVARAFDAGLPTKLLWVRDIVGRTNWIDEAVDALTENVYLTIDVRGLDPSIMPSTAMPEPGGLGWYETLKLIRKLAKKRRVVGMNLVEYTHFENQDSPAFLCAKLIYKSLAYIFNNETPKVIGKM